MNNACIILPFPYHNSFLLLYTESTKDYRQFNFFFVRFFIIIDDAQNSILFHNILLKIELERELMIISIKIDSYLILVIKNCSLSINFFSSFFSSSLSSSSSSSFSTIGHGRREF